MSIAAHEVLERARRAVGKGCIYGLGKGGFHPGAEMPFGADKLCDCSGFVAWCLNVSRFTDHPFYKGYNGGWLETTAIVRDALKDAVGMMEQVEKAQPGDLIVYGDHKDGAGNRRQGHVGIVVEVHEGLATRAVHCSKGNERRTGDAIAEGGTQLWISQPGWLIARCALVQYP